MGNKVGKAICGQILRGLFFFGQAKDLGFYPLSYGQMFKQSYDMTNFVLYDYITWMTVEVNLFGWERISIKLAVWHDAGDITG